MDIRELPEGLLQHETFHFIAPDMARVSEMQNALNQFTALHHEFLLWSPGEHRFADVSENMAMARDNFRLDRDEYKFLIISNSSDRLLGCISLFIRNSRIPHYEIGYWLATDAMGSGIMTRACTMVRDIARDVLQAKRIEIRCAGRNERSQRVALKCGFTREATLINERVDSDGNIDDTCIFTAVC